MTPVQRTISGAFQLDLGEELDIVRDQLATATRTARTLIKNGPLRATLVGLAAGAELAEHSADGPITVHVLEGEIDFDVHGKTWELRAGSLLALDAGAAHTARSKSGGVFLLTVAVAQG